MDLSGLLPADALSHLDRCAFCRRDAEIVPGFVAGHEAAMCGDCAAVLADELSEHRHELLLRRVRQLPRPTAIRAALDGSVVGQDRAKRALAVQAYNHYKRLAWRILQPGMPGPGKANVLLTGPTGSGKTHLVATLAHRLEVPFAVVDATALTGAGGGGAGPEAIARGLLRDCDWDAALAGRGVVYLDEIDKLAEADGEGRGTAAQQALLSCLEGRVVSVARANGRRVDVDTADILFIAGGSCCSCALPGAADAQAAALRPELAARFPVCVPLTEPGGTELDTMLTEPPDAPLRQARALLAMDGCDLWVSEAARAQLVAAAQERGSGARGLRAVVERALLPAYFAAPACPGLRAVQLEAGASEPVTRLITATPQQQRARPAA